MIENMEVYRSNDEIVFVGKWNDGNKDLPDIPKEWIKTIEPVEKMPDGTYLAVSDYKARRIYPRLEDQLDYIYHNGIDGWRENMIKPIKEMFPKYT